MKQETSNVKLRVLVVCSANSGKVVPYIAEQVDAIEKLGLVVKFFLINEKGLFGYLRARNNLITTLREFQPDIIHAHYGLSGLLANLQRNIPVVTTYHGSDINNPTVRIFSKLSIKLSKYNIFVSQKLLELSKPKGDYRVLACGVNLDLFKPQDKMQARVSLGLDPAKLYVLFAGSFSNLVKNYSLAKSAVELLDDVILLELKGYTREQVALLMNAVDSCLMCSFSEGSPQFVKEAVACGCPVVSTRVGDVPQLIENVEGCYLVDSDVKAVSQGLKAALTFNIKTKSREHILELDNSNIANKIVEVYKLVLEK